MRNKQTVVKQSGIYEIRNILDDKRYIGSALDLKQRCSQHWSALKRGNHTNLHLQNAWNKHGEDAFEFKVIRTCMAEDLIDFEQNAMDSLRPEYNILPRAGSNLGKKDSETTRRKKSKAQMGNTRTLGMIHSEEAKRKIGEAHMGNSYALGYTHSEETKQAISRGNIGKIRSEETKRKMSIAQIGNTKWLGKIHSEETKRKISEANTGKIRSEETKRKIRMAKLGTIHSEETRRKMSETHRLRAQRRNINRVIGAII